MLNERKTFQTDDFLLGVCYYPEHWDRQLWEEDFRRMAEMGFNVVRMGETAWNLFEPEEGKYDFALFDDALNLCDTYGLKVIMGTPTYAPPIWLTEKYPEVLRVDFRGQTMAHGSRRHYNYTSPIYLQLCRKIVTAMAEHYKNHEGIIGWQIDNELNCHMDVSFADSDHKAFREWCFSKYGKLDVLNTAWGTAFWAQTYSDWDQVCLPKPTVTYHNPSHLLDFYLFTSESTIFFAEIQYQILKKILPSRQFVTHNGIFGNVDYYPFTERTVDFLSYDSYPAFQLMRQDLDYPDKDRLSGKQLSRVRGLSAKFMVLEQQAGPGGQIGNVLNADRDDYLQATPKPGQMRLWTWQSIAHGADGILYFRWRTCPFGAEMLWHGLNQYGNQPHWRLEEARQISEEIRRLSDYLVGSTCEPTAAILYDYANDSNCKIERQFGGDYWKSEEQIYLALSERHLLADMLDKRNLCDLKQLSAYKIIFYANAQLMEQEDADLLLSYVEQGGTLILGPRSGYKNSANQCHMLPFPGVLQTLTGVQITDFTMLNAQDKNEICFQDGSRTVEAPVFNEILQAHSENIDIIATYIADYYAGEAAVSLRKVGQGQVVYCGTFFTLDNVSGLLDVLQVKDPLSAWSEVPPEIEVIPRKSKDRISYILLNYTNHSVTVRLKTSVWERLSEQILNDELVIEPYGVRIIHKDL